MRVLATLSILASSMLFTQPASAIGTLYSIETGSGDVRCSDRGFFTISNNAVIGSEDCYGSVIIPLGVTSIATGGFRRTMIVSATIPNSVTSIGNGAFEDARDLASITIPDSVIELGVDVFGTLRLAFRFHVSAKVRKSAGEKRKFCAKRRAENQSR